MVGVTKETGEEARLFKCHCEVPQVLALLMGSQARLGARSDLRLIPRALLRLIGEYALWPRLVPTFRDPEGPHRMSGDRRTIGWEVARDTWGFSAVAVAERVTKRHGVAAVELTYTGIDDGALFRAGDASLRIVVNVADEAPVADVGRAPLGGVATFALVNGVHVPALDDCWSLGAPIAVTFEVDANRGAAAFGVGGAGGPVVDRLEVALVNGVGADGVPLSAEDHSDGVPLDGESEWRASVRTVVPLRESSPVAFCADADCFCRHQGPRFWG